MSVPKEIWINLNAPWDGTINPVHGTGTLSHFVRADIAQAPAPVRVKALQWREEYQKWSADSYTATATGVGCTYIIASSMGDLNHDAVVDAKKAAAQADYEARILAALEAPPDAGVVAELVEARDDWDELMAEARAEAAKAMRKFPQPNYVISKIAEEAGEVVKAAIHCAEGRETAENLRGEMKQTLAMLYRLWVEGDQVHGLPPVRAALAKWDAK